MICTVTCNPSLDYTVRLPVFRAGAINRVAQEAIYPGGKGINVGIVLQRLGLPVKLLGFTAGFTGREIQRLCRQAGCSCDFIEAKAGVSRINVKVGAGKTVLARTEEAETPLSTRAETALNGLGPVISEENVQALFAQMKALQKEDILVLSGSIPKGLPQDLYRQIIENVVGEGVRVVVDAEGKLLTDAIPGRPFLIKPNREELEALFGKPLQRDEDVAGCAVQLQQQGARSVLVSMGGDGALLAGEDGKTYRMASPQGTPVNSVGAGDSMVAGFLAGYCQSNGNLQEALRYGIASGSATAFKDWLAEKEEIELLLR